ncbi:hypothetical protein OAF47_00660 [bacterium]|nr:hypothetical protein [bacterium]
MQACTQSANGLLALPQGVYVPCVVNRRCNYDAVTGLSFAAFVWIIAHRILRELERLKTRMDSLARTG